jgi:putative addiction module component, TIGR02574 family
MVYPAIDLERLTIGERLQLIEQVWDSLRRGAPVLQMSQDERAVIEARRAEHRENPGAAVAWDSVRAELLRDQEADEQQAGLPKRG